MPTEEEIVQQQSLLTTHRRTLGHLLQQVASYGGVAFSPPQTSNGIDEARGQIQRLKGILHGWGVPVDDHPNDDPMQNAAISRRLVDDGLRALPALMQDQQILAAFVSGRDKFEDLRRQIETLGRYKALHDELQQLEDAARIINGDRRRLPNDIRAWRDLGRTEPHLSGRIDAVLVYKSPNDKGWPGKLERARQEARAAIDRADIDLLNSAMNRIDDVLGSIPWQINARLVEVADGLSLQPLAQTLGIVREHLNILDLDEATARQYSVLSEGVAALGQLDQRLRALVRWHNTFQELDNELRRFDADADLNGQGLVRAWPDMRALLQDICTEASTAWAAKLVATAADLEESLVAFNEQLTMRIFWRYQSQVSQSFNHVDTDLLKLCDELHDVGKSLDFVLRDTDYRTEQMSPPYTAARGVGR